MAYLLTALLSYLIGTSNMAFFISKMKKVNLRNGGSGNLGASNTVVMMGWKFGVLVGIHDIAKSAFCVLIAGWLLPELPHIGAVAGVCSVLGHIFPFYLRFRGGKGFASYIGMTFALNWKLGIVIGLAVILVTLVTDYIVCGTTLTIVSVPVWMGISNHSLLLTGILLVATAVIAFCHRENYVRMYKGTEIGLRSASKGDHRVK